MKRSEAWLDTCGWMRSVKCVWLNESNLLFVVHGVRVFYLVKSTMVRPSWSKTFSLKFKSVMSMRFLELSTVIGSRFLCISVGVTLFGVEICEKRRDGIPNFRAAVWITRRIVSRHRRELRLIVRILLGRWTGMGFFDEGWFQLFQIRYTVRVEFDV